MWHRKYGHLLLFLNLNSVSPGICVRPKNHHSCFVIILIIIANSMLSLQKPVRVWDRPQVRNTQVTNSLLLPLKKRLACLTVREIVSFMSSYDAGHSECDISGCDSASQRYCSFSSHYCSAAVCSVNAQTVTVCQQAQHALGNIMYPY